METVIFEVCSLAAAPRDCSLSGVERDISAAANLACFFAAWGRARFAELVAVFADFFAPFLAGAFFADFFLAAAVFFAPDVLRAVLADDFLDAFFLAVFFFAAFFAATFFFVEDFFAMMRSWELNKIGQLTTGMKIIRLHLGCTAFCFVPAAGASWDAAQGTGSRQRCGRSAAL
jgi:hypothetical protein